MEKIKITGSDQKYQIKSIVPVAEHVLQIIFADAVPAFWNGDIQLYTDGDVLATTLTGWTTVYRDEDQTVYLSDDGSVYVPPEDPEPGINVSTKFVYENLHANDLRPEQHPDIDGMIRAIKAQDLQGIADKLGNVLETVTVKEYPVIQEIKDKMVEFGAIGSLMSGSGPTVFGLFTNPKAAQQAYEELRYGESSGLAKQVYLTNFYNQKEENNHGKQA